MNFAPRTKISPRAAPPFWKRLSALLWLAILLVAQSWHICELGGHDAHAQHQKSAKAELWKPKCGGGLSCPCEKPAGALYSPTGQALDDAPDAHSHTTCLARLLMAMPGEVAPPFSFASFATQSQPFAPALFAARFLPILPQPPSRGPPVVVS